MNTSMRGITTIEWLVIATIVLIGASQVITYWDNIWSPLKSKAEEKSDEFSETIADLSSLSQLDPRASSLEDLSWLFQVLPHFQQGVF